MENLFVQKHKKVKWFKAGNVEDIPEDGARMCKV
jgi:hypothetical protein